MKKTIGVLATLLLAASVQAGDVAKGQAKAATCAACHGADGNSAIPGTPHLAGQGEKYLVKQLADFKANDRKNATMAPMANMLSDEDMQNVAAYFSQQQIQHVIVEDKYIELGQKLYRSGDSDRDIPACTACHGANGLGLASAGFPALGGQQAAYTKAQLEAFRSGARDNDANSVMRNVVAKMSDEQIEAISHYLAGLH